MKSDAGRPSRHFEGSLKEAGAKLKSGLEDLKSLVRLTQRRSSLPLMWNAFRNENGDHDRAIIVSMGHSDFSVTDDSARCDSQHGVFA